MQYAAGWLADHRGVGTAALCCALGCAVVAFALAFPLNGGLIVVAVFLLGGFITSFLTLALIASTMTVSGTLSWNVSLISMLYTGSAVAGPLIAGAIMNATHTNALMWFTSAVSAGMACALGIYMTSNRTRSS
jgi:MFS family permease